MGISIAILIVQAITLLLVLGIAGTLAKVAAQLYEEPEEVEETPPSMDRVVSYRDEFLMGENPPNWDGVSGRAKNSDGLTDSQRERFTVEES